ncbi:UNVERIFIED_ORG: hypothetical protein M2435_004870 [Rhizobium sophorae]|jgi:hypothetical protein|uniref:Uncharacterized protein n=1 Tax=Rhizobium leguminosarum bv. trifolii TaxID=386 RepID=A0A1C9I5H3_RHILT|nr:hypothetical protein [Rhizobium leguminosarum bv. trifolii]MBB4524872.1 hypothetical protein [Rhizobium leguminosarum]MBP2490794.1 hypothetical protein [Rhizobium leguminosarum]MDH6661947.1 hypothetical protein [Rhizobium sophorae]
MTAIGFPPLIMLLLQVYNFKSIASLGPSSASFFTFFTVRL